MMIGCIGVVLVVALLLAGSYAYLNSSSGQVFLAQHASRLASSAHAPVTIVGIRGQLLRDLTIARITLADKNGVWLEVEQLHVAWSPRALLRRKPSVQLLEAARVHVYRLPVDEKPTPAPSSSEPFALRSITPYLPQQFALRELLVEPAVTGSTHQLALQGGGDGSAYMLDMHSLAGIATELHAMLKLAVPRVEAALTFREEAGGLAGGLLGLPDDATLAANVTLATDAARVVHITQGDVQAGTARLTLSGSYALTEEKFALAAQLDLPEMQLLQGVTGTALSGNGTVHMHAQGTPQHLSYRIRADLPHLVVEGTLVEEATVQWEGEATPPDLHGALVFAGRVVGEETSLHTKIGYANDTLTLEEIDARHGAQTLTGEMKAEGLSDKGTLTTALTLTNPYGTSSARANARYSLVRGEGEGSLEGSFQHQQHRFTLEAKAKGSAAEIALSPLRIDGPGIAVSGAFTLQPQPQHVHGRLTLDAPDLAPLGHLLQQPLSGAVKANVEASVVDGKQTLHTETTASKLRWQAITLAQGKLIARTTDLYGGEGINATLNLTQLRAADTRIAQLQATAKGSTSTRLSTTLEGKGQHADKPWNVTLAAALSQPKPNVTHAVLSRLEGAYANAPIRLASPATFTHDPTTMTLTPLQLQLAGGTLRTQGSWAENKASGSLTAKQLQLARLPLEGLPSGTVNATLTLSGTPHAPVLGWKADSNVTVDRMPMQFALDGSWKQQLLRSNIAVKADRAHAKGTVELPARLSLSPMVVGLNDATPLRGKVEANLPLGMLNPRLAADGHRLGGSVEGGAKLLGTLGAPAFDGAFALKNGQYDHRETGLCLRNTTAVLRGNANRIVLENLRAVDAAKHTLTGDAIYPLQKPGQIKGSLKFAEFSPFCGDMLRGAVDGTLNASGSSNAMLLAGKLSLESLTVQIPGNKNTAVIPEVETEWLAPGKKRSGGIETPMKLTLDIALNAPNRLFVRGRGLDAEFGGKLWITGTADQPKLDGTFEKRRGKFTLLDRVLTLQTATLQFKGPLPPSPFLNVEADTKVETTTVKLTLAGPATKPKLTLSSDPALPQDEALALLLFGRKLDKISPFEAVKLAQATRTLAGFDDGPGLLGTVRDTLGLDTLDVGTDDQNNVSVTTGKYVTDKVFVGVEQGVKPEDREVVTEITLSPSVSGKASVDAVGNQGVGFEWKRDY